MARKIEVTAVMIDDLDHIGAKLEFMSDACTNISKQEHAISEDAAFGMMLVFNEITDQVAVIKKEITAQFQKEIKTAKV